MRAPSGDQTGVTYSPWAAVRSFSPAPSPDTTKIPGAPKRRLANVTVPGPPPAPGPGPGTVTPGRVVPAPPPAAAPVVDRPGGPGAPCAPPPVVPVPAEAAVAPAAVDVVEAPSPDFEPPP